MEEIETMYQEFIKVNKTTASNKIVSYLLTILPDDEITYLNACEKILQTKIPDKYNVFTKCIQKNKSLYKLQFMPFFEKWVSQYVNSWGECDVFCYRIINPMIEKYPILYVKVQQWSDNKNPYIRRLSLVSLIHSSQTFSVIVPFRIVSETVDRLINDENYYVQKAIGWLLKYTYLSYRDDTMNYLKENNTKLSKIVFAYAKQKMNEEDKILLSNWNIK